MNLLTTVTAALFVFGCFASKEIKSRDLILNEQELRFAGNALHTVLALNANSYVSWKRKRELDLWLTIETHQRGRKGNRRFSGTFSIVERENRADFDVRINADVDLMNGNGNNGNRNRYLNSNYNPNNNYPNNLGNSGRGNFGSGGGSGYAGQFNY